MPQNPQTRHKTALVCQECLRRNYTVVRGAQRPVRMALSKHCPACNRHTVHKETR